MSGLSAGNEMLSYIAMGLLLVGFAFKVSAVPFHMWTPDAYEGAPAVVTAFMSAGVKAAAFAAFVRVFMSAFGGLQPQWEPVIWMLSAASMILGAVAGVVQRNVRRMLAYSSIAHAGYLMMAMAAGNDMGKGAILFYLLTYALTSVGAFGITALVATRDAANDDLSDYAGLATRQPLLAFLMTIFLLSLGGFPPTAGFIGKWYLFSAAVSAGDYGLAIIGVLTSVVSVFFYLRIVVMMYMSDEPSTAPVTPPSTASILALAVPTVATFYLGLLPARVLDLALRIHRDDSLRLTAGHRGDAELSFRKGSVCVLSASAVETRKDQRVSRTAVPRWSAALPASSVQSQSEQAHGSSPLRSLQRDRACASCTLTRSKYSSQYGRSSSSGVAQ